MASSSNALLSLTKIAAELEPFLDWEELSARVEDETLMGHHLSGIARTIPIHFPCILSSPTGIRDTNEADIFGN